MKRDMTVEAFTDAGNYAVIRLPGRKFPGVVFQGDSLWSLRCEAFQIHSMLKSSGADPEVIEEAMGLCERLDGLARHYEATLAANGIDLPYYKG